MSNTLYMEEMGFAGIDETQEKHDYSLSEQEALCLQCPLDDCKENSVKCLINISKKIGVEQVKVMLSA